MFCEHIVTNRIYKVIVGLTRGKNPYFQKAATSYAIVVINIHGDM